MKAKFKIDYKPTDKRPEALEICMKRGDWGQSIYLNNADELISLHSELEEFINDHVS